MQCFRVIIGILKKAGDAKELTGIGQEKEIVALAYNSALAKKVSNGDSSDVTAGDLNTELANQGATANGSNPIKVTFSDSKRQYTIDSNGEIKYSGIKNDEDNNIQLSITSKATESRAFIIKVIAISTEEENILTESKLQEMEESNSEQVQELFVEAYKPILEEMGAPDDYIETLTWNTLTNNAESVASLNNDTNFITFISSKGYSSAYDIIIKNTTPNEGLNATFTCDGNDSITGTSAEFIVTNPNPTITATVSNNGSYAEQVWNEYPQSKIEEYSEIQNSNYKLEKDGYEVWIPAGFAYGTSGNVGTVTTGLVITDSIETVDGKNYSNGNEFVWIPVDKENLTVGSHFSNPKIAEISSGSNYRGILYKYKVGYEDWGYRITPMAIDYNAEEYREPDEILYGNEEYSLQSDYNAMIASVKRYGGFYVARYEMGKGTNYSKIGVTPTSAANNDENMWYGLYEKAKTYSKDSITAGMIWGSQYDAIFNSTSLNTSSDAIFSNSNGNHTETILKTGTYKGSDTINNIFDVEGNINEWTQEAYSTNSRVYRGGTFNSSVGSSTPGFRCDYEAINNANSNIGSRLSMYINP